MQVASTSVLPITRNTFIRCASSSSGRLKSAGKKAKRLPPVIGPNVVSLDEAVKCLKALSADKAFSAYELTLVSKLATSVNINSLRGRCFLTHDASNSKKKEVILVFAEGEKADEARREGADIVGGKELIDELISANISPTKIISTPELLSTISRSQLPRILGPKGLMPSAKRGTVTDDIAQALKDARGGLDWKAMEAPALKKRGGGKTEAARGVVSVPVARAHFDIDRIRDNVRQFTQEVLNVSNGVGTQAEIASTASNRKNMAEIQKMYLKTTQSMSFEISDHQQLLA